LTEFCAHAFALPFNCLHHLFPFIIQWLPLLVGTKLRTNPNYSKFCYDLDLKLCERVKVKQLRFENEQVVKHSLCHILKCFRRNFYVSWMCKGKKVVLWDCLRKSNNITSFDMFMIWGFYNGRIVEHYTICFDFEWHLALHPNNLSNRRQSGTTIQFVYVQFNLEIVNR
jgi:hypothetical protein